MDKIDEQIREICARITSALDEPLPSSNRRVILNQLRNVDDGLDAMLHDARAAAESGESSEAEEA